jgi:hypothetical protein
MAISPPLVWAVIRVGRTSVLPGQHPADAGHQPFQHRPVELIGTAEMVDDPRLDVALLRMPRVLGEGQVADDGAVLVPSLGGPQVHTHEPAMSAPPNQRNPLNSCAHKLERQNHPETRLTH